VGIAHQAISPKNKLGPDRWSVLVDWQSGDGEAAIGSIASVLWTKVLCKLPNCLRGSEEVFVPTIFFF